MALRFVRILHVRASFNVFRRRCLPSFPHKATRFDILSADRAYPNRLSDGTHLEYRAASRVEGYRVARTAESACVCACAHDGRFP